MASADAVINCGYARVCIRILSRNTCGKTDEKLSRSKAFKRLFAVVPDYCPDKSYFEQREGRDSYFDRNCKKVLQRFCQKWHPPESHCEYMVTFSMENWKQLPLHLKRAHTMSNCQGCLLMHEDIQANSLDISVMTIHQLQSILQLQNSRLKCLQNLSRKM